MFRLRKWIILRLVSIVDNLHVEKEEALVEEVARCETGANPNSPWVGGLLPSRSLGSLELDAWKSAHQWELATFDPSGRGALWKFFGSPGKGGSQER